MAPGVATNDEECVIQCDGFRLLEFDLRPGDNPLTIHRGSDTWTITPLLQAGFYLDRGHTKTVQLEGDDPLHYDHVRRLGHTWNVVVAVSRTRVQA